MNKFVKYFGVACILATAVGVSADDSARGFRYRDDNLVSTWALEPVYQMYVEGILTGTPDGYFKPKETLNRAEAAVIILRAKGITPQESDDPQDFADVPASAWYYDAIQEMVAQGWMQGNPNGTFAPGRKLNKAEWFTLLYRAFEMEETMDYNEQNAETEFSDVADTAWFSPAVRAFNKFELHRAKGMSFGPSNEVTRQDAAWTMMSVMQVDEFKDWYKEAMAERERNSRIRTAYGLAQRDPNFDPDLQGFDIEQQKVYYNISSVSDTAIEMEPGSDWEFIGTIEIENTFDKPVKLGHVQLQNQFDGSRGDQSDRFQLQVVGEDINMQEGNFSNQSAFFVDMGELILTTGGTTSVDVYMRPDASRDFFPNIEANIALRIFDLDGFREGKNGFTSVATNDVRDNRYFTPVRFTTPDGEDEVTDSEEEVFELE